MAPDGYRLLIRSSPSLLLVLDEALTCRDLSQAWRDRLGTDVSNTAAPNAAALFDVDDDRELLGRLAAVARDGTPLRNAAARVRLSGGVVPCRLSAWRVTREADSEPLIAVAATDFSDYEEAVARLAQLESHHRLILDAAGEGIYGLDRDGRITFGNAAAAEIVGWVDVLGQTAHDVHHHSHRDGSPYAAEDCPIYAALKDGEVHTVENEVFWHADGTAIPVEYTSTPILKEGKPDGAVVIFRNVSQRKELERQRAEAFEQIKALKNQLEQERDYLRDEINVTLNFGEIIGESQALRRTLAQIEAVASTPANVLVLGESGVGKEMIARAIHFQSDRSDKPLVKVNCASIPKDLFESEFFGHVRGAFTGAHRERTGRLQLADGGTLFLDEVGEIPLSLQGKLLRALQEREFERVGDDRTVRVDVRVVAATNRDLVEDVKAGRFREDLFYRLSVFPIEVPPLRERVDDIAPLAAHFLEIVCKELGREPLRMTRQQLRTLRSHHWPGNIRELRNVIERAAISSSGSRLRLDLALAPLPEPTPAPAGAHPAGEAAFLTESELRAFEKANLVTALQRSNWQVWGDDGAAALLGIKPSTLTYRMKRFGIKKPS
jgi:PAS domain S-box-containing protein